MQTTIENYLHQNSLIKKRQEIDKVGDIFPEPRNCEFYKRLEEKGLVVRPA